MIAPRKAARTVQFVDDYCAAYEDIFPEVRSFESFKYLHVGMISQIKRKSLPEIAKVVGLKNEQALHHLLTESPWKINRLVERRLSLTLSMLKGETFILVIDETGDKKKGNSTDYVSRQYIGNLGKVENGLVSVNAYGVLGTIVFPLTFKIFKPKTTLQEGDIYKTKPELAGEIIQELRKIGFKFEVVLADCLYGESKTFRKVLDECELKYVLAVRSNHQAWTEAQKDKNTDWYTFDRIFANGKEQVYYIQEIICSGQEDLRYWKITKDIFKERKNTTWYLMTNLPGEIKQTVGNTYGFRNWIEYGLKQAKNELGWADFRLTNYDQIQKWWEIVCCVYLMVSWHAIERELANKAKTEQESISSLSQKEPEVYSRHEWWNFTLGWKSTLSNLYLIIQPYVFFNLLKPWLDVFHIPLLKNGFISLQNFMNQFQGYITFNSG
ncbi:transposase (plasmid) [Nostoc sp. NIES-2111]|nr:transposase [Nostoc sp. NIES-2111]